MFIAKFNSAFLVRGNVKSVSLWRGSLYFLTESGTCVEGNVYSPQVSHK